MKCKYCFLRSSSQLHPGDFVYCVWVGNSLREQVKFELVRRYAEDCALYFRKWSNQVDSVLDCAADSVAPGRGLLSSPFRMASVSISELYSLIIDDSFDSFERSYPASRFEIWLNFRNDPAYLRYFNRQRNVLRHVFPSRKNLSVRERSLAVSTAGVVVLVCGIYSIDAFVSALIRMIF